VLWSMDPSLLTRDASPAPDEEKSSAAALILLPLAVMAFYSVKVTVLLGILNLLPAPPLDGGRIMVSLLPPRAALALARVEPYGMMLLVGLLIFDRELRIIH